MYFVLYASLVLLSNTFLFCFALLLVILVLTLEFLPANEESRKRVEKTLIIYIYIALVIYNLYHTYTHVYYLLKCV